MKRRDIGIGMALAGLLTGSLLAGGILLGSGGSGPRAMHSTTAANIATATATPEQDVPVTGSSGSIGSTTPEAPVPPALEPTLEPTVGPVNEGPFLTGSAPHDGQRGVAPDAAIEVSFSEAVDQASAEAAFSVSPNVSGTFSWDDQQKVMTYTPDIPFDYNTKVEWSVAKTAEDLHGLGMIEDEGGSFHILRQKTMTLYSQPQRDGYAFAPPVNALEPVVTAGGAHNALFVGSWTRGFLSFDLAKLPAKTVDITGATLHLHQRDHHGDAYGAETGALWAVPLNYGDLDIGDYGLTTPMRCPNACYIVGGKIASSADGWKSADVTPFVRSDWKYPGTDITKEAIPGHNERLSQFRLQFLNENKGAGPDVWAEFHSGEAGHYGPRLEVTFVYP